jgi:hypothetical protein
MLVVEYSTNVVDFTAMTVNSTIKENTWTLKTSSTSLPTTSNLRIRFSKDSGVSFRLDDVKITGTAPPTVTIANTGSPAAGDIIQGTDDDVLFGFSITPSASVDFTAVSIATAGTADAGDLDNFRLVYDADNDGVFDGGESVIATVATLANPLVFNTFSPAQTGVASARRYLLIADVAADATVGATFTASIAAESDVTTTGDESGTAAGNAQTVISATTPTITASTASLTGFGDVAFGATSSQETFTVSADNLTTGVTVTAPTHFEIALETDGAFDSELVLPQDMPEHKCPPPLPVNNGANIELDEDARMQNFLR